MVHTFQNKKWPRNSYHRNRISSEAPCPMHNEELHTYSKPHLRKLLEQNKITSTYFDIFDNIPAQTCNSTHQHYMNHASDIALLSPMQHKHGCVIVNRNKITGTGFNTYGPTSSKHAETCAMISAMGGKTNLDSSVMYVVRIAPGVYGNTFKYSKPCESCQKMIDKTKIRKVFYSTSHGYDIQREFGPKTNPIQI
jgi:pyrimidine deaminase RibD-like protein